MILYGEPRSGKAGLVHLIAVLSLALQDSLFEEEKWKDASKLQFSICRNAVL